MRNTGMITPADDVGEDVLALLEGEVERWKNYYNENEELLSTVKNFLSLFYHMLELKDRDKDPSRLFNTRGGALLQEEKAKKKVRNVSDLFPCCLRSFLSG